MFTGFPEETLRFFMDIRFHNNATFFNENRERYRQEVTAPFYAFIEDLAPTMLKIDPGMEIRPYKCLARIRRDTRFSKDKSPYRDHLWLLFRRAGEPREMSLNFWFEYGLNTIGWGMGFWGENRPAMDAFRRLMAAKPQQVLDIIDSCNLPEHHLAPGGSAFKRLAVPDNLPAQLRLWYMAKELFVPKVFADPAWAYDPKLVDMVRRDYEALVPVYKLLRGIVDDTQG